MTSPESPLLSNDEIERFTGCKTMAAQRYWLNKHEVPYSLNAAGEIILFRKELREPRDANWRKTIFLTKTDLGNTFGVPRRGMGVYFLLSKKKVLYVGKTTNFFVRMAAHDKGDIPFESVFFMPIEFMLLDIFEREYIARFDPPYNAILKLGGGKNAPQSRKSKRFSEG